MLVGYSEKRRITGFADTPTTLTLVEAVTEPTLLVAVNVYTVVLIDDTSRVPEIGTTPTPWFMETEVAPVTFHCSIEEYPTLTLSGLAVKLTITGSPADGVTFMVVETLTDPELFVAVNVYMVVVVGDTALVPASGTEPMP